MKGDTETRLIKELDNGFKLFRTKNAGGVDYSYIKDAGGHEILSTPTADEDGMLAYFEENKDIL